MLDVKRALAAARAPERTHTLPLSTPWGDALAAAGDDAEVLPEHPRPTLERASYTMLNGWWDYAFVPTGQADASPLDLAGALALVSTGGAARDVCRTHPRALLARGARSRACVAPSPPASSSGTAAASARRRAARTTASSYTSTPSTGWRRSA